MEDMPEMGMTDEAFRKLTEEIARAGIACALSSAAFKAAVERESLLLTIGALCREPLPAQAAAEGLSLVQLGGYVKLLCAGENFETAAGLMRRVPDEMIAPCLEMVLAKLTRG